MVARPTLTGVVPVLRSSHSPRTGMFKGTWPRSATGLALSTESTRTGPSGSAFFEDAGVAGDVLRATVGVGAALDLSSAPGPHAESTDAPTIIAAVTVTTLSSRGERRHLSVSALRRMACMVAGACAGAEIGLHIHL